LDETLPYLNRPHPLHRSFDIGLSSEHSEHSHISTLDDLGGEFSAY